MFHFIMLKKKERKNVMKNVIGKKKTDSESERIQTSKALICEGKKIGREGILNRFS